MAGDPYWNQVVLAMHMDGANASTVFTDLKGKTVTAVGNAQISTAQSKFGGASAKLDGTGDYLTLPNTSDFDFPSAFTIDGWVYMSAYGASWSTVISRNVDAGTKGYRMLLNSSAAAWLATFYGVDSNLYSLSGGVVATGAWYHLELGFDGTTYYAFTNGVLNSTLIAPAPKEVGTTSPPYIGINDTTTNWPLNGYVDDLRITKGACRHTASFTPPATAFIHTPAMIIGTVKDSAGAFAPRAVRVHRKSDGALSGATVSHATTGAFAVPALDASAHYAITHDSDADPYWSNVVLATHFDPDSVIDPYMSSVVLGLHMEGANASTVFQDVTGKTITAVGNAKISTAQAKFGNSSALFDGTGDYLTVSAALLPATADFTVEIWFYKSATSTTIHGLLTHGTDGTSGRSFFYVNNDKLEFFIGGSPNLALTSTTTVIAARWHHAAVTRVGSTFRLFLNGVLEASGTSTTSVEQTTAIRIGKNTDPSPDQRYWNGYIDDLRVTSGVARYTANFTPPTVPFSSFKDLTGKDLMVNGVPSISTVTKKYGDGALSLVGTQDGLEAAHPSDFLLGAGNFTIELYVNMSATTAGKGVFSLAAITSTTASPVLLYTGATGVIGFYSSSNGSSWNIANNVPMLAFSINTWYHLAACRNGPVIDLFVDGVKVKSIAIGTTALMASSGALIGGWSTGGDYFDGLIDDLRITKGIARYQTDFTPPERAFPGAMGAGTRNALIFDDLTPV